MHLNIKNDKAHALASQLATLKGISMTEAVTEALQKEFDIYRQKKKKTTAEEIMAYVRSLNIPKQKPGEELSLTHGDEFYDEHGLPK